MVHEIQENYATYGLSKNLAKQHASILVRCYTKILSHIAGVTIGVL